MLESVHKETPELKYNSLESGIFLLLFFFLHTAVPDWTEFISQHNYTNVYRDLEHVFYIKVMVRCMRFVR